MASDDKARTLSDADISSQPSVSRRSLLGTLGLGVAAAVFLGASPAQARRRRSDPCYYRDRGRDRGTARQDPRVCESD